MLCLYGFLKAARFAHDLPQGLTVTIDVIETNDKPVAHACAR
jgi:hypothetical protein